MKYEIKIPKPCNSKWSEMTPTEKGMFCSSCEKEVIDFTNTSNYQLAQLLDGNQKICGKFKARQLNREILSAEHNQFSKAGLLVGISTLLSIATPAFGQNKATEISIIEQLNQKGEQSVLPKKESDSIQIKGNAFDTSGGLASINIMIKGSSYGTQTDTDGNFSIPIATKEFGNNPTLVFSSIGFKMQEIEVTAQTGFLKVKMIEDDTVLGDVEFIKKQSFFRKVGNLFRKKENKNCH